MHLFINNGFTGNPLAVVKYLNLICYKNSGAVLFLNELYNTSHRLREFLLGFLKIVQ